jgi:hypothetical protein
LVPPLLPLHAQAQGPVPVTVVAVPALQRPAVGAVETATPFAEPQTPLTAVGCSGALHEAFVPPLLPLHVQFQGPAPVTVVAVPAVQRPVVGAVLTATPFAGPQTPLTPDATGALQDALAPPLDPEHPQVHGPDPLTAVAVPAVQSPAVGAVVTATPFAEPQTPVTGEARGALHEEIAPPLLPLHIQAQGPVPVKLVAVPELQRPAVGAVATATPFAGPQNPLTTAASGAAQDAVVPPR